MDRNFATHARVCELIIAGVRHQYAHLNKDIVSRGCVRWNLEFDLVNADERRRCACGQDRHIVKAIAEHQGNLGGGGNGIHASRW